MRLTRKRLSSKNNKVNDAAKSRGNRLQYRCTIQGIQIFYREVKDKVRKEHHDAFEKTPFKHLFKALHDDTILNEKKKDKLLDNLILCYDRKTKKFKFGSEFYKPTRLDVKLVFGIEDGTEDVSGAYGSESKLGSRYFTKGRITIKKVKDKVKELIDNEDQESIDDTVKLLCVLILHNVLFPNTGASITRAFLYYVDDFDRLNSFDWSQHVLDELMNGLHADWSKPKQVNGCILLLPYWFCEHSYKIPDMYKNGEENEPVEPGGQGISSKGIPRLTKWKLKNLEQLVEKSALQKMDRNMFNNNELIPTIAEEHLIKSLCVKQKAKNIVLEHDLGLEQPLDGETSMGLVTRKSKRLKRVTTKIVEEGSGVESGYSSEGNQESEAAQAEKDIENNEEPEDNSESVSNAEAESAHDELMKSGFDMSEIHMSENVEEPRNSSKGKSIAESRNVRVQGKRKKKKELRKTGSVLGKRKKRLTKENIKEKNGLKKDVKMRKLEEENSRLKGIVDSLKREKMNLIGKQETMAAEQFEMEIALDDEVSKKTELLSELENEKLARKELLNELALAKIKIGQQVDKAKENETMDQDLQAIQNLPDNSVGQNFSQGLIQQQEVDKTMIDSLGKRVGAERFEMEMVLDEETMATKHFEMEMALDEEITKKTVLLSEPVNEKLARKDLLNELTSEKIKDDQHKDKAKENESVVQNIQTYIQNLVPCSGNQNFGQESIQQQEVDKTMIETLGERVTTEHFEMEIVGDETMASEHMEMADEEITKKTELLCELEKESEAKENESVVQKMQNIVPGSGSQNFGQESIQQQEVDKTMIESLGERVAAEHFEKEMALGEEKMAAEHFEMEVALDEEITTKTESRELDNESEAKENETVVQNLQTYIPNFVPGSGSQNFGQESIQQQEVDKTMIDSLGERVVAEHFETEMALGEETMAAEHSEMEVVLDEETTKETELCELENEKLARKNLLDDQHEDKAKENERMGQNLQAYIHNLVPGSRSQNFGQESIQQQEVDKTMIDSLGERVAAEHFETEMALGEETMATEHSEMEVALGEETTKKTELGELENEKLARKNLLDDQHEDKTKENESVGQNLQAYVQNLVPGSRSQNFGQESIQQQEVDKMMIESLGEGVARLDEVMHEKDTSVSNLKAINQDHDGD